MTPQEKKNVLTIVSLIIIGMGLFTYGYHLNNDKFGYF